MALVSAHAIWAFHTGSNLFPLGLIFTAPPALIYLLILMAVRRSRLRTALLTLAVIACPLAVAAQASGKPVRIGVLCLMSCEGPGLDAFRETLRDPGYVEGRAG